MHFVSSSIYHKATRLALQEGLSAHLFDHHKLAKELASDAKYIPIHLLFEIYELADTHLPPGFGLRQGMQLSSEDYGTLGLSWRTCWRAREVLDRTERFMVLVTDHGNIQIEESGDEVAVRLFRDATRTGVAMANEATFVMFAGVLREVTGKSIHPLSVHFRHHSESDRDFEDFFQCPVVFGEAEYSIRFNTEDIDIPTIKADQHIHQYLVERMDEEKQGIQASTDRFLSDIQTLIEEALPSGIPGVSQVAEYLGLSERTLKRRLSDKGLTFRDFVQQIQQDTSRKLIVESDQSMAEIAFQTGFSEQSAFNRAFKRWTGQSPVDYRRNAA